MSDSTNAPSPTRVGLSEVLDRAHASLPGTVRASLPAAGAVALPSSYFAAVLIELSGVQASSALAGPGSAWRLLGWITGGLVASIGVATVGGLLVTAAALSAWRAIDAGGAMTVRDVWAAAGDAHRPALRVLGRFIVWLLPFVLLPGLVLLWSAWGLEGPDPTSAAVTGVLGLLALGVAFALGAAWGVARYALALPIARLEGGAAKRAFAASAARLRGRPGLGLGLAALFAGLIALPTALTGALVPSPSLEGLTAMQVVETLPAVLFSQWFVQAVFTISTCGVGIYAAACLGALERLTAGE